MAKSRRSSIIKQFDHLMTEVSIDDLNYDPANRRQHSAANIKAIRNSLQEFGQVLPVVVQKSSSIIVGGNASVQIMRNLGYKKVKVVFVDIDDDKRKELAIRLNRTGELSHWDYEGLLKDIEGLQSVGINPDSMGFDARFVEDLIKEVRPEASPEETEALETTIAESQEEAQHATEAGDDDTGGEGAGDTGADGDSGSDSEDDDVEADYAPGSAPIPVTAIGGDQSIVMLKDDPVFPSTNWLGIPDLLPKMLGEPPGDIGIWCGEYSDPHEEYLAVYKRRSLLGLDRKKSILCFYTQDATFEDMWENSGAWTQAILPEKWKAIIAPNWSIQSDWPEAVNIFNYYRRMFMARYWQEAGIKVIPDVDWGSKQSLEYSMLGIPRNAPCIGIQLQTGDVAEKHVREYRGMGLTMLVEKLKPQALIAYGGKDNDNEHCREVIPDSIPISFVPSLNMQLKKMHKKPKPAIGKRDDDVASE